MISLVKTSHKKGGSQYCDCQEQDGGQQRKEGKLAAMVGGTMGEVDCLYGLLAF